MKTIEFIYQETEIHFLINPSDKNVMINATEMAKAFNKRLDVFLKTKPTKEFIKLLEFPPVGVNLPAIPKDKIIETNHRYGTFFHRELAIEFAMWLDPVFKRWIINKIDEVLFGNYKKHWEAHVEREQAKEELHFLKQELLADPTPEKIQAYFDVQGKIKAAEKAKKRAINQQYKLF